MISPGPACCLTIVLDFLSASVKVTLSPKPSFRLSKTPLVGLFPYATWFSLTGAPKSALPAKYNANKSRSDFTASACWLIIWAELTSAAFAVVITFSAFCLICFKTSILNWSFLFVGLASSFAISACILSIFACNSVKALSLIPLYLVASSAELAALVSTALNPLPPWPGMACPLRESWFLFAFSSFLSAVAFGILSNTKALFFNATVALSTSPCVAVSLASRAWALANSAFPSSIAEAVFSVTPAFAIAFWTRAIAALRLALLAFATVGAGASSLAVAVAAGVADSLALFIAVSLLAKALPPPKNANPAATNTDAVPTLNFLIPYWLTFSSCFWSFIFLLFLLYILNLLLSYI